MRLDEHLDYVSEAASNLHKLSFFASNFRFRVLLHFCAQGLRNFEALFGAAFEILCHKSLFPLWNR